AAFSRCCRPSSDGHPAPHHRRGRSERPPSTMTVQDDNHPCRRRRRTLPEIPPIMSQGTFATRWNLDAVEENFRRWQQDPNSVDPQWQLFFEGFQLGLRRGPADGAAGDTRAQGGIFRLIYAYRNLGHFL